MSYLKPITVDQWTPAHARHLLNRAGFGIPEPLVELLAALPPREAVARLVQYPRQPEPIQEPDFLVSPRELGAIRLQGRNLPLEERRRLQNEVQRRERQAVQALQAWWLERIAESPCPLEEKMALFWHGHFATSAQKVRSSYHTYALNRIFRQQATGNFKMLTTSVGQSFSMLTYLDNFRSTKQQPNENWARELMELFTLGQGVYTEDDVKAAARAFTGWTRNTLGFEFRPAIHDTGEKTFLGRTGAFAGEDILDIIFEQPAAATFISGKLWSYFAYEDPEPELVEELAALLRQASYSLKPLLTRMFLSEAFYSEQARATQVKSPVQLVVQLCEDLGLESRPYPQMARATAALGQNLFYPPNVKGWDGNRAWINANTLLQRYNLPQQLAQAASLRARQDAVAEHMQTQDPDMESMQMGPGMQETTAPGMQEDAVRPPTRRAQEAVLRELERQRMQEVATKLLALPPAQRRIKRQALQQAGPAERAALLRELGVKPLPWQQGPAQIFEELEFDTGAGCLKALEQRFLVTSISSEQRQVLQRALGIEDTGAPLSLGDIPFPRRRAALHLITSMAEYQLC